MNSGFVIDMQMGSLNQLPCPFGIAGKQMELNLECGQMVTGIKVSQIFLGKEAGDIIGIKLRLDNVCINGIVEFLKKNNFIRLFHTYTCAE